MLLNSSEEYKKDPGINQSRLKMIENPGLFRNFNKQDEEDGEPEHFKFGTFVDDVLADIDVSEKYFGTSAVTKTPSDDIKKLFTKFLNSGNYSQSLDSYKEPILKLCEELQIYSSYKADTKWERIKVYGEYFDQVKNSKNKIILDSSQFFLGSYYKTVLTTDPLYKLYYTNEDHIENRTKIRISLDYLVENIVPVPLTILLKGELDRIHINHNLKTVTVVDDKTTADLYSFKNSIYKYRYDFQLGFYKLLLQLSLKELGLEEYTIQESILIAMDSTYANKPLIYKLENDCMQTYFVNQRKYIGIEEAINLYAQHMYYDVWDMPIEQHLNGFIYVR
jgi:hypothetical protein